MTWIAALLVAQPTRLDGILFGKSVVFDHARVQKRLQRDSAEMDGKKDEADVYVLTFQKGSDVPYDQGIKIHVSVNPGAPLAKLSITQPAVKFGTPEYSKLVHGHSKDASCGRGVVAVFMELNGKSESVSDQVKFKFFCKPQPSGSYQASIFAYNSEFKSGVQGSFTFKLEKTQY
jgi:hypothetical protein